MERVPLELWEKIFATACMDGGYTGRSLSRVSHYIHSVSRSARYTCISVAGHAQMAGFANLLQGNSDACSVHRLFLSDTRLEVEEHEAAESSQLNLLGSLVRAVAAFPYGRSNNVSLDTTGPWGAETVDSLVQCILRALSSSLKELTLFITPETPFTLVPVSLPVLEELTCYRSYLYAHDAPPIKTPPIPSLRRLSIINLSRRLYVPPVDVWKLAPLLTHLRLSELRPWSRLGNELRAFLGMYRVSDRWVSHFPASIERIVVHVSIKFDHSNYGALDYEQEWIVEGLQLLIDNEPDRLAVVYNSPDDGSNFRVYSAQRRWLKGNAGWDQFDPKYRWPQRQKRNEQL